MVSKYLWTVLLIVQWTTVTPRSTLSQRDADYVPVPHYNYDAQNKPKEETNDEQVISVRVTSSIVVAPNRTRLHKKIYSNVREGPNPSKINPNRGLENIDKKIGSDNVLLTEIPEILEGANMEYLKQLNAKKDIKRNHSIDQVHPLQINSASHYFSANDKPPYDRASSNKQNKDLDNEESVPLHYLIPFKPNNQNEESPYENLPSNLPLHSFNQQEIGETNNFTEIESMKLYPKYNATNIDMKDALGESSIKSAIPATDPNDQEIENVENVPLARSLPFSPSSKNNIHNLFGKPHSEIGNNPSLTTVSFDIVHDTQKQSVNYNGKPTNTDPAIGQFNKFYEPPKVYSQPAKIYSEPAKFYSEPAKIYSEPAKIYSEPAKIYSEPSKIYSEPAKFYSEPASLHLNPELRHKYPPWQNPTGITEPPWQNPSHVPVLGSSIITSTSVPITQPAEAFNTQRVVEQRRENNYEVEEKLSILSEGRSHGVQDTTTEKCKQDNCKVGYVVEGRQYKKYRVEERTPDGFIVGEYGVVRNEDGALRGVRYTADSEASPRLIHDALMKFLQLK